MTDRPILRPWRFAGWTETGRNATRDLLKLTERPNIISLAGGMPAAELFPLTEIEAATARVLRESGRIASQYGPSEGIRPLRELIAERMTRSCGGMRFAAENILVITGSQQGLDLLGKTFLERGDTIALQFPTFLGALDAWSPARPIYRALSWTGDAAEIRDGAGDGAETPKFLYILPNFQNPTGETLNEAQRDSVLALSRRIASPVVEDNPYGDLLYDAVEQPRHIISRDADPADAASSVYQGATIYLGTFSKTLVPGFRVGWMAAAPEVIERLILSKQGADLGTSALAQLLVLDLVRSGLEAEHLVTIRRTYRERRDAMLAALERHLPGDFTWTRPTGGMFIWVTMPEGGDARELLAASVARGVAFVPGDAFYPANPDPRTFRLNFSNGAPAVIEQGIKQLAAAIGDLKR
jgi:2-aminoadipate transaminase